MKHAVTQLARRLGRVLQPLVQLQEAECQGLTAAAAQAAEGRDGCHGAKRCCYTLDGFDTGAIGAAAVFTTTSACSMCRA